MPLAEYFVLSDVFSTLKETEKGHPMRSISASIVFLAGVLLCMAYTFRGVDSQAYLGAGIPIAIIGFVVWIWALLADAPRDRDRSSDSR